MTLTPATIVVAPGTKGTTSGLPATVIRHYDGNMYEVKVPGGVCCIDIGDFKADPVKALPKKTFVFGISFGGKMVLPKRKR